MLIFFKHFFHNSLTFSYSNTNPPKLPIKHIPTICHVVFFCNPEHTPSIRNHALALVTALDWTE